MHSSTSRLGFTPRGYQGDPGSQEVLSLLRSHAHGIQVVLKGPSDEILPVRRRLLKMSDGYTGVRSTVLSSFVYGFIGWVFLKTYLKWAESGF